MLTISLHTNKFDKKPVQIFKDWKNFWKHISKEKFSETHTLVIANLALCSREEKRIYKPNKDEGFWIVELFEKD